jgi:hypothetical protein
LAKRSPFFHTPKLFEKERGGDILERVFENRLKAKRMDFNHFSTPSVPNIILNSAYSCGIFSSPPGLPLAAVQCKALLVFVDAKIWRNIPCVVLTIFCLGERPPIAMRGRASTRVRE